MFLFSGIIGSTGLQSTRAVTDFCLEVNKNLVYRYVKALLSSLTHQSQRPLPKCDTFSQPVHHCSVCLKGTEQVFDRESLTLQFDWRRVNQLSTSLGSLLPSTANRTVTTLQRLVLKSYINMIWKSDVRHFTLCIQLITLYITLNTFDYLENYKIIWMKCSISKRKYTPLFHQCFTVSLTNLFLSILLIYLHSS